MPSRMSSPVICFGQQPCGIFPRRFRQQNAAARELNVVGMRADRQDAAGFRLRGHKRSQIRRFRRG